MSTHDDPAADEQRPEMLSLWKCFRREPHWKCLVVSLLVYGCVGAVAWCRVARVSKVVLSFSHFLTATTKTTSPCDEGYVYVPLAFLVALYLVYLVECWHSSVRVDMDARVDAVEAGARYEAMRDASPLVWWKAVCYHYVRRTRQVTRYRNGDAYTTIQVYYERVNSHTSGSSFEYSRCGVRDASKRLVDLDRFAMTRLAFTKNFAFTNRRAARDFEEQRALFFREYETQDDYMEMREGLNLLNVDFRETAFAFSQPTPWFAGRTAFWLASALLLSWPLRLLLAAKTAHVQLRVVKLFGGDSDSVSATLSPTSPNLEWNITCNTALVPSYSQALLLDAPPPFGADRDLQLLPAAPRGPRHSWSTDSCRANSSVVPNSSTRLSLHESTFYHATSLVGKPRSVNREGGGSPPSYEVAIRVCRPLAERSDRVGDRNETAL